MSFAAIRCGANVAQHPSDARLTGVRNAGRWLPGGRQLARLADKYLVASA
jgi:hypothetical protein